jgi:UDP-3-O-[3-hydroxymyristoyl] glucosamine N-acyltransferase
VLAGQAGLVDNIELGNGAVVGAQAGVTHSFGAGQQIFGSPADDSKEMRKVMILTRRLPKLAEQLKLLSKRIEKLESAEDNQK